MISNISDNQNNKDTKKDKSLKDCSLSKNKHIYIQKSLDSQILKKEAKNNNKLGNNKFNQDQLTPHQENHQSKEKTCCSEYCSKIIEQNNILKYLISCLIDYEQRALESEEKFSVFLDTLKNNISFYYDNEDRRARKIQKHENFFNEILYLASKKENTIKNAHENEKQNKIRISSLTGNLSHSNQNNTRNRKESDYSGKIKQYNNNELNTNSESSFLNSFNSSYHLKNIIKKSKKTSNIENTNLDNKSPDLVSFITNSLSMEIHELQDIEEIQSTENLQTEEILSLNNENLDTKKDTNNNNNINYISIKDENKINEQKQVSPSKNSFYDNYKTSYSVLSNISSSKNNKSKINFHYHNKNNNSIYHKKREDQNSQHSQNSKYANHENDNTKEQVNQQNKINNRSFSKNSKTQIPTKNKHQKSESLGIIKKHSTKSGKLNIRNLINKHKEESLLMTKNQIPASDRQHFSNINTDLVNFSAISNKPLNSFNNILLYNNEISDNQYDSVNEKNRLASLSSYDNSVYINKKSFPMNLKKAFIKNKKDSFSHNKAVYVKPLSANPYGFSNVIPNKNDYEKDKFMFNKIDYSFVDSNDLKKKIMDSSNMSGLYTKNNNLKNSNLFINNNNTNNHDHIKESQNPNNNKSLDDNIFFLNTDNDDNKKPLFINKINNLVFNNINLSSGNIPLNLQKQNENIYQNTQTSKSSVNSFISSHKTFKKRNIFDEENKNIDEVLKKAMLFSYDAFIAKETHDSITLTDKEN